MNRLVTSILICGIVSVCLIGCGEKSTIKRETKISTPGGTTTVTTEQEVKKTGDNPPAVNP